jgi:hypothetical protein
MKGVIENGDAEIGGHNVLHFCEPFRSQDSRRSVYLV